ncbi:MAG: FAD-dependent oxidoreductase [Polyangiaceae bacterium]|jgi:hypothetical protein|nr:FAD-dependent oxidoreductase [Polyangiaceae bacterium]
MQTDLLIIGAGVAGLACAREMHKAGRPLVVVDKARAVGGRCATRHVDGQPVDFGVAFLHGSDPSFLRCVTQTAGATLLPDWPTRRAGAGRPCQPDAFAPHERRFAIAQGLRAFPEHLASGLDVRLGCRVTSVALVGDHVVATVEDGTVLSARDVVVALSLEQSRELVQPLATASIEMNAVVRLLRMIASLPCLTLFAGYDPAVAAPGWDVCYPQDSRSLMLLSHDSTKRAEPRYLSMVLQALPKWSHDRLESESETWGRELLAEAAQIVGPWAASPLWTRAHRWRYARVDRGSELAQPVLVTLDGDCRIGLAGDVFAPGGGIQAAWLSGRRLANRLLGREEAS